MFAGSDAGGERPAAICSLIETVKMQELDLRKYLVVVLDRIADHPINRIDDLLPGKSTSKIDRLLETEKVLLSR